MKVCIPFFSLGACPPFPVLVAAMSFLEK